MVNRMEKNTTVHAQSVITVDGSQVIVAFMNATLQADGNASINHAIQDKELFAKYSEEVRTDFDEFDNYVYSL